MSRTTSRSGMTLLELVVGLTITGMALSAGYGALASLVDHGDRATRMLDALSRAAAERRALREWLEAARVTVEESGPPFRGLDGIDGRRPNDELTFLTTARTPLGVGGTVVRLYIDRDTLTPERGLVAEFTHWPDRDRQRLEIEPRADALDCRYLTRMLGHAEWLPSWISTTVLPAAVELRLEPAPGDTLPPLLARPLVVPLGNDE